VGWAFPRAGSGLRSDHLTKWLTSSSCHRTLVFLGMNLTDIIKNPPTAHRELENGEFYSMGLTEEVLNFISTHIDDSSHTLETGCGLSTAVLALLGARHICITPVESEIERIQDYCKLNDIPTNAITFYPSDSEIVLPNLECAPLDLVLIDGRHGFPAPFIDFYYTADKLKIGGLLVIDDTYLWTGDVLKQLLLLEPEWEIEADFAPRACVFRKLAEGTESKEWTQQQFVVLNSEYKLTTKPVPYSVTAFRYLKRGEFSILGKMVARKLGMLKEVR
jgi:predicted O-methyltransferase YrrM